MKFIGTETAVSFLKELPNSSTRAILVLCENGKEYVFKHGGSIDPKDNKNILIAEYLGYLVAKRFGLPIPEHVFIRNTPRLQKTIDNRELNELVSASPTICIGPMFIHHAIPPKKAHYKKIAKEFKEFVNLLFGFDQYLYNIDRMPENPNLIYVPIKKQLMVIDHSLAIWPIMDKSEYFVEIMDSAANHVFYPYIKGNFEEFKKIVKNIFDPTIKYYIDTIPEEWLNNEITKEFLKDFLTERRDNIDYIMEETLRRSIEWKKKGYTSIRLF